MDGTTNERSHPLGRVLSSPKYLICDWDRKYATHFSTVAVSSGIKELRTLYLTPQANGICERFMRGAENAWIISSFMKAKIFREYSKNTWHTSIRNNRINGSVSAFPNSYNLPK
jgi:hypothetical protein